MLCCKGIALLSELNLHHPMLPPSSSPLGFHYISHFDWQVLWGEVKMRPKLYRKQNVFHYLEAIVCAFQQRTNSQAREQMRTTYRKKWEHWHKQAAHPFNCVYSSSSLSPSLYCTQGNVQIWQAFNQSKFKRTLRSHVSKTSFYCYNLLCLKICQSGGTFHRQATDFVWRGKQGWERRYSLSKRMRSWMRSGNGNSQAMRTWALRLLVVPAELQATHWHQKSSGPKSSSTCCRVISMLASRTTRPSRKERPD